LQLAFGLTKAPVDVARALATASTCLYVATLMNKGGYYYYLLDQQTLILPCLCEYCVLL
jgi:hypothetical protein